MNITILGCGRWASFHAWYQAEKLGNKVLVWGRNMDTLYTDLVKTRKNEYLTLPETVDFTSDLQKALNHSDYIIISISAQGMPEFSKQIAELCPKNKTFILSMKGIIAETGARLSEVLENAFAAKKCAKDNSICVWVGPGHVQEFIRDQPNIMIIDGKNRESVTDIVMKFRSGLVKLYEADDLIGVEIGAAAKNVLGIVAGILDGAGFTSLKGALMARGVYEVARLIVAMGGKQMTPYGISHLGDFEATLFSDNSHNRKFGENFMRKYIGLKSEEPAIPHVAEGFPTAKAIKFLAETYNVEMPICALCYSILYEGKDPFEGLKELFLRDNIKEFNKF